MSWMNVLPPIAVIGGVEVVHPYIKSRVLNPSDAPGEVFTVIRVNGAEAILSRGQIAALSGLLAGLLEEESRRDLEVRERQLGGSSGSTAASSAGAEVTSSSLAIRRDALRERLR
jgi:hypothetical protein